MLIGVAQTARLVSLQEMGAQTHTGGDQARTWGGGVHTPRREASEEARILGLQAPDREPWPPVARAAGCGVCVAARRTNTRVSERCLQPRSRQPCSREPSPGNIPVPQQTGVHPSLECPSVSKRKETLTPAATRIDLEDPGEASPSQKAPGCGAPLRGDPGASDRADGNTTVGGGRQRGAAGGMGWGFTPRT